MRGYCLRVNLKRDPAGSVPQKLLNGLYVFSIRLQKSSEGMAEGVPTDLFMNARLSCHGSDVALHQVVRPVGLLSLHDGTCENPITRQRIPLPYVLHPYPEARFYATHPA